MAKMKIFGNDHNAYDFCKWVADTTDDVKKIIPRVENIGSEVYVIDTDKTYVLGSDKAWHPKTGGEVIPCDCVSELTVWNELT